VVVIPEGCGVLLERVEGGAGLAGDIPVFGLAVVLGRGAGAVDVDAGADVRNVMAATVKAVVDGEEVLGGKLVDPLDVEWLVGAGLDERGKGGDFGAEAGGVGVGIGPEACGGDVAVDLGVDLAHGDAELLAGAGVEALGERKWVDEGRELERVEHGERWRSGPGRQALA